MRKYGWKLLGVLLVGFSLIGGLLIPLKIGITGVRLQNADSLNVRTGQTAHVEIDIYNFGDSFNLEQVLLKRHEVNVMAESHSWNPAGTLFADFKPIFGRNGEKKEGLYNLYVKANGKWMAFPAALSISKSAMDTADVVTNPAIASIDANPDLLKGFPNRPILNESIRNLLYHVPMWFSMIFVLSLAAWYAIKYLNKGSIDHDLRSDALVRIGILAGILGCVTGSFWAHVTWDSWWPRDPKLNGLAIGMVMYLAYLLLRAGIRDEHQKARISAVYNLFVFPIFIALIIIMPKISGESNHPGAGGTVTFKQYDLDNTLRMFFYPAVLGWILLFSWLGSLLYRYKKLEYQKLDEE
jgi:heme exporter protein C